ncbi:hypothetical protein [Psychroserpens sp.]
MNKSIIAIFFSFLFLSLALAPTILLAVDDSIDISFFYDISEEEEEKEGNKEFEIFVVDLETEIEGFVTSNNREHLEYAFKTYQKPHLNLIFPPPELI